MGRNKTRRPDPDREIPPPISQESRLQRDGRIRFFFTGPNRRWKLQNERREGRSVPEPRSGDRHLPPVVLMAAAVRVGTACFSVVVPMWIWSERRHRDSRACWPCLCFGLFGARIYLFIKNKIKGELAKSTVQRGLLNAESVSHRSTDFFFYGIWLCSVFSSKKKALCRKKISRHIKLTIHAWSTKCRWN
jgi:hypothetical protein